VGAVSKSCQEAYLSSLATVDKPASSASHRVTTFAAAVTSVSRLQEAIAGGLPADDEEVDEEDEEQEGDEEDDEHQSAATLIALHAGKLADRETPLWLKANCASLWGEALCCGAVIQGRLDLLQWLHDEQQCPWSCTTGCMAASENEVVILKYVYSKHDGGVPEPDVELLDRLEFSLSAVESNDTELLQWCHDRQLLCDSTGDEKRLHYRAVTLQLPHAAEWLAQHGFENGIVHGLYTALQNAMQEDQQGIHNVLPQQVMQGAMQRVRQRMVQHPVVQQLQQHVMQHGEQQLEQQTEQLEQQLVQDLQQHLTQDVQQQLAQLQGQ
jgi:hypothetical protein